jgi:DNA-binding NarL/FixJ family response regulator
MKHVLIADDFSVTRRGLREIMRDTLEAVEIAEAADYPSLLELFHSRPWDLLVLDVMMPGGNVIDALHAIRQSDDAMPVLIMTALTEPEYVIQTLRAGASGFIHKHRAADELMDAVRLTSGGQTFLDADSAGAIAGRLRGHQGQLPHEKLSPRELEVLRLIAGGQSTKQRAARLGLSPKTVATYLARIREKTGLGTMVDMARYVLSHAPEISPLL